MDTAQFKNIQVVSAWKESSPIFFIGLTDAPKYDIIWTENENLIDRFFPEILMFNECLKRVKYVFERQYLWKEAINQVFVFSTNNVIIRGIR